ncbi:hypothetical protein AVEN_157736-1 [Araneus ventricosus]|uniref:Uncharacterized protein n=1 Tax=Araneus ventricosus TaxID=182803 RepID=A0A4Y2HB88_ARAVE|nr:hypothetical protein AVEN_157736-1 [Araneus ventricosus]
MLWAFLLLLNPVLSTPTTRLPDLRGLSHLSSPGLELIRQLLRELHECRSSKAPAMRKVVLSNKTVTCNDGSPAGYDSLNQVVWPGGRILDSEPEPKFRQKSVVCESALRYIRRGSHHPLLILNSLSESVAVGHGSVVVKGSSADERKPFEFQNNLFPFFKAVDSSLLSSGHICPHQALSSQCFVFHSLLAACFSEFCGKRTVTATVASILDQLARSETMPNSNN